MARFLSRTYFGGNGHCSLLPPPDKVVTSTASRALATAQLVAETMKLGKESLLLDSRLYLAEPEMVLQVVRSFDEKWKHAFVFGHNPGMHEFVDKMLARTRIPNLPTCAAVIMGLPHEYWGLADWREAQLIAYITPKALERRFPSEYAGISKQNSDD